MSTTLAPQFETPLNGTPENTGPLLRYIAAYNALVCSKCSSAVCYSSAVRHLSERHHIPASEIRQRMGTIPRDARPCDNFSDFPVPDASSPPIPGLPVRQVWACASCGGRDAFLTPSRKLIQKHAHRTHNGNSSSKRVTAQTWFRNPKHLKWFQIGDGERSTPARIPLQDLSVNTTMRVAPSTPVINAALRRGSKDYMYDTEIGLNDENLTPVSNATTDPAGITDNNNTIVEDHEPLPPATNTVTSRAEVTSSDSTSGIGRDIDDEYLAPVCNSTTSRAGPDDRRRNEAGGSSADVMLVPNRVSLRSDDSPSKLEQSRINVLNDC